MIELTYTKVGDYYIPDLALDEEPEQDVFYGKYGDLRREYLREHKPRLTTYDKPLLADNYPNPIPRFSRTTSLILGCFVPITWK